MCRVRCDDSDSNMGTPKANANEEENQKPEEQCRHYNYIKVAETDMNANATQPGAWGLHLGGP